MSSEFEDDGAPEPEEAEEESLSKEGLVDDEALEVFEEMDSPEDDPDLSKLVVKPGVDSNLEIRRAIEARNEQKKLEQDLNYLELDMDLDDDEV